MRVGAAACCAAGVGQTYVVGVSLGGVIRQAMAARIPDRVTKLTSIMASGVLLGIPGAVARPAPAGPHAIAATPAIAARATLLNARG